MPSIKTLGWMAAVAAGVIIVNGKAKASSAASGGNFRGLENLLVD